MMILPMPIIIHKRDDEDLDLWEVHPAVSIIFHILIAAMIYGILHMIYIALTIYKII